MRVGGAIVGEKVGVASWVTVASAVGVSVGGDVEVVSGVGVTAWSLMERTEEKPTINPNTATPVASRMKIGMIQRNSLSLNNASTFLFVENGNFGYGICAISSSASIVASRRLRSDPETDREMTTSMAVMFSSAHHVINSPVVSYGSQSPLTM